MKQATANNMKKKLSYPTWAYKSKKTYAKSKDKQWDALLNALFKFQNGSAWLPPNVRNLVSPVKLDAAIKSMNNYVKRVTNEASNG